MDYYMTWDAGRPAYRTYLTNPAEPEPEPTANRTYFDRLMNGHDRYDYLEPLSESDDEDGPLCLRHSSIDSDKIDVQTHRRAATPPPMTDATSLMPGLAEMYDAESIIKKHGIINGATKAFLRDEFRDTIDRDVPVIEFVKAVWNFVPEDIPHKSGSRGYCLNEVREYLKSKTKRSSYIPLRNIIQDLTTQLIYNRTPAITGCQFVMLRNQKVTGPYMSVYPDFCWSSQADIRAENGAWMKVVGDVKWQYPREVQREVQNKIPINVQGLMVSKKSIQTVPDEQSLSHRNKRKASDNEQSDRPTKRVRTSKEDIHQTLVEHDPPPGDSATLNQTLTEDEILMAKSAYKLTAQNIRTYSSGTLVNDRTVTLWYADRMGLITSASFDFIRKPELLLLVVAAITFAAPHSFGICPFIKYPNGRFSSYADTELEIPADVAVDADGKKIEQTIEFVLDVSDKRSMFVYKGAIGRGTTILPLKAKKGYALQNFNDLHLAAKMGWPSVTRGAEDNLVRKIRGALTTHKPDMLKHIVDLKLSCERTVEQMQLPRWQLQTALNGTVNTENRVFRMIVTQEYCKLESVESVDEFKTVFLDVVRAHHWVWEVVGVLHRDISHRSIMFHRKDENVIGVLCDWDYASNGTPETIPRRSEELSEELSREEELKANAAKETDGKQHLTGIGLFMAIDMLQSHTVPSHLYRHDLESFFYLLVYVCATFSPKTHEFRYLANWEDASLVRMGITKLQFLKFSCIVRRVFKITHSDYAPLTTTWVKSLRKIVRKLQVATHTISGLEVDKAQALLEGKDIEDIERNISILQEDRDRILTYSTFMEGLGAEI